MTREMKLTPYPIEDAERIAKIMGGNSAIGRAINEMKSRKESGEDVGLFISGSMILVGPNKEKNQK